MSFGPDDDPIDNLLSRLAREVERRKVFTVKDIWMVESRSADRPSENSCMKNSYAGTIVDDDNGRKNIWRYLQKLYTYMLALAKVGAKPLGNAPADKRGVNTPSQVICPLDVLLRYRSRTALAVGKSTGADVKT